MKVRRDERERERGDKEERSGRDRVKEESGRRG